MKFHVISRVIAFTVFATFTAYSPVMAFGTQKTSVESSPNSRMLNDAQGGIRLPILLARNDYYRSLSGDFEVMMPGDILKNESGALASTSLETKTVYTVFYSDLPAGTDLLSNQDKLQILKASVQSSDQEIGNEISDWTNISIKGHPGIQTLTLAPNGSLSLSRYYIVRNRIYNLSATSPSSAPSSRKLGQEVKNFFNSFEVYPNKIIPR